MMPNKMHVLAVTGGIGAGKSCVTDYLASKGIDVVDADKISHELTAKNAAGTLAIAKLFGEDYVRDGVLDRKKLAQLVFSNEEKRAQLNALMHPMVLHTMKSRLAELEKMGKTIALIDVPLLFESGADALADEIWCVDAPIDIRIARIAERDGMSEEQARARIASQMDDDQRKSKSDVVLENIGELTMLYSKIDALLKERGLLD